MPPLVDALTWSVPPGVGQSTSYVVAPVPAEGTLTCRLAFPLVIVQFAASPLSGHTEMMRITKHFPNAMVTPLSNARGLPYVEANEKLFKVLDVFLTKHKLR